MTLFSGRSLINVFTICSPASQVIGNPMKADLSTSTPGDMGFRFMTSLRPSRLANGKLCGHGGFSEQTFFDMKSGKVAIRCDFSAEGNNEPIYCEDHAQNKQIVNVDIKLCAHEGCCRLPTFDVEGSKIQTYYKTHTWDVMVNIRSERCAQESCIKRY